MEAWCSVNRRYVSSLSLDEIAAAAHRQPMQRSGFDSLDKLGVLVAGTRTALSVTMSGEGRDATASDFIASQTLPHLSLIEEGVTLTTRAEKLSNEACEYLLRRVRFSSPRSDSDDAAAVWFEHLRELRLHGFRVHLPDVAALEAIDHARVVFYAIPTLPAGLASWPGWRDSYRDLMPPPGPNEVIARVEEMGRVLWRVVTEGSLRGPDESARRTYAFFETAVWLQTALLGKSRSSSTPMRHDDIV